MFSWQNILWGIVLSVLFINKTVHSSCVFTKNGSQTLLRFIAIFMLRQIYYYCKNYAYRVTKNPRTFHFNWAFDFVRFFMRYCSRYYIRVLYVPTGWCTKQLHPFKNVNDPTLEWFYFVFPPEMKTFEVIALLI